MRGPWVRTEKANIVLFTRPVDFSATASPDSMVIANILLEQENIIVYINRYLRTDYNSKFEIYLYNFDEAKEKIGTNGGGSCDSKRKWIFFTYYRQPVFNTYRNEYEYLGVHETVHLIAGTELGYSKTRFFGEGYSNAIDGNYGAIWVGDTLVRYRNDSTLQKLKKLGKLSTPGELLHRSEMPPDLYYPQIGCLMKWLFDEYGVENMNRLYTAKEKQIEKKFFEVTGESFADMERKYLAHLHYN